ncbi:hypothetical protein C5C33_04855 [Rathayibacter sp. AY1H3]|nr:hypothetical protein C5C33_04855 [Rathayibacter sp. AY1H3]
MAGQTAWTRRQIVERGSAIADRIVSTWAAPLTDSETRDSGVSWRLVLDLVAAIPAGRWASYGDIATVAGTHPVPLGQYLTHNPVPNAYRVLKQSGQISPGFVWEADSPHAEVAPDELLRSEGLIFDPAGRADPGQKLTVPELAELVGLSIHSDIDSVPDEGNSERADFLSGVADRQAPSTVHGVVELLDEWERLGGILDFGAAEEKSCFLVARGSTPASKSIWPLTLYPSGSVEVVFQHMRSRSPLDSVTLRQALLSRLNAVSGVDLPADRLEKRPSFDLEVLADRTARLQLVEVLEWFMSELVVYDNARMGSSE